MRAVYPLLIFAIFLLGSHGAKIVVYYTNWAQYRVCNSFVPENLKPIIQNITHINYAFAQFNTSGYIAPTEYNDCDKNSGWPGCMGTSNNMYNRVTNLKLLNPSLIISITIGGSSWNNVPACPIFSAMAANSQARANFVAQAVAFARKFNFDGIDIDWEFPGGCSFNDTLNFQRLLSQLRSAINSDPITPRLFLSIASPSAQYNIDPMNLPNVVQYLDQINVMCYDYHGDWDTSHTGVNAPLYRQTGDANSDNNVNTTISTYNAFNINSKLVLGMPTYGRTWSVAPSNFAVDAISNGVGSAGPCTQSAGVLAYYEINSMLSNGTLISAFDSVTQTPYGYTSDGSIWVSYDNIQSLGKKVEVLKANKWSGAMFWTTDFDDFMNNYPLISFVSSNLTNYDNSHISSSKGTRIGSSTNYIITALLIGLFTFI